MIQARIKKIKNSLSPKGLDAILICRPENRYYLSGFTGSAGYLLITEKENLIFTDFRYIEQVKNQCPDFQVIKHQKEFDEQLKLKIEENKIKRLGIEEDYLSWKQFEKIKKLLGMELKPADELVESFRIKKDEQEINLLQKAAQLADEAFAYILPQIKEGIEERNIALKLEFFMREKGASGAAFDFIIASGSRSALPHGVASSKKILPGDFIMMDYGCIWQGYHSDITRTIIFGQADRKQKEIYQIVQEAQLAALESVKPGVTCEQVDAAGRKLIEKSGYGGQFGHALGHGVGLNIHEAPRVGPGSQTILEPGMVVTIEPGIYLNDWGGVRIEDTVLVTPNGYRRLTTSAKDLVEVG